MIRAGGYQGRLSFFGILGRGLEFLLSAVDSSYVVPLIRGQYWTHAFSYRVCAATLSYFALHKNYHYFPFSC